MPRIWSSIPPMLLTFDQGISPELPFMMEL
jgi:hypothetical protein